MKRQINFYRYLRCKGLSVLAALVVSSMSLTTPTFADNNKSIKKQAASNSGSRSKLSSVKKQDKSPVAANVSPDSVYVVSDAELKTYSGMNEVIEENKILKEQRQVLLDHTRLLREKYKKLHDYCSKTSSSCPESISSEASVIEPIQKEEIIKLEKKLSSLEEEKGILNASLEKVKLDLAAKDQEILMLKQGENALKDKDKGLAVKDEELKKKDQEIVKLKADLEAKINSEKAILEQLETSSAVILKISELEKEIVSLQGQLLMKKTTAELLGVKSADANNDKQAESQESVFRNNVVSQNRSSVGLSADVTIVEVVADKVSLRVGPGPEHSAIMDVQRGTRLTVEAREGKWLRVNSPTGGRAFISSEFVRGLDRNGASQVVEQRRPAVAPPTFNKLENIEKDEVVTEQDIQMNLDAPVPVKPSMPKKAPRKVAQSRTDKDIEPFGEVPNKESKESVAMEKLMKAMQQPDKVTP